MNMNQKTFIPLQRSTYFFLRNLLIKHIDLARITATETVTSEKR